MRSKQAQVEWRRGKRREVKVKLEVRFVQAKVTPMRRQCKPVTVSVHRERQVPV